MAKNNNLNDFLTDIADAIRLKKGTTENINPQKFSSEIASIYDGSDISGESLGDVNYIDYDGTILYSYTAAQFIKLTAHPTAPTRAGLVFQEWNWPFADALEYVKTYGCCDIGATYTTNDGKTRLYIRIDSEDRLDITLNFKQTVAFGTSVDWGEGNGNHTTETINAITSLSNSYEKVGDYIITITVADGCEVILGGNAAARPLFSLTNNYGRAYANILRKVEIGNGITGLSAYAFYYSYSLSSVTLPNTLNTFGNSVFRECRSIKHLSIPYQISNLGTHVCYSDDSIQTISLPPTITSMPSNAFINCFAFRRVVIPPLVITIAGSSLRALYCVTKMVFPNVVNSIAANSFTNNHSTLVLDFSHHTSIVPTLENVNALSGMDTSNLKILVPSKKRAAWVTATNWSSFSANIIGV